MAVPRRAPEVRIMDIVFPADTNSLGTMFGGSVMARMDKAAVMAAIRYQRGELAFGAAPASWGFDRGQIPYLDGIPIIRDYYCESSAAAADAFAVVDLSKDKGLNLVVSKALSAGGLAKVGLSEKAYVNFWGAAVYKSPRNIFVHVSLSTA